MKKQERRRGFGSTWMAGLRVGSAAFALAVGGVGAIGVAPSANAQQVVEANVGFSIGGDMGDFSSPITQTSLKTYHKMLSMDEAQKEALAALHEGYMTQHQANMKAMQDKMKEVQEKFNETKDFTVWQKDFPKAMKDIQTKAEQQEKEFYDDFKTLLSDGQAGHWAGVERHRRREKNLKFGFMAGEGVDLVRVSERAGVDVFKPGEFRDTLQAYEGEMDKVLVAKEKFAKESSDAMGDGTDMAKMMENATKMMKTVRDQGRQQRSINKDYSGRLQRVLSESDAAKFLGEYRKAAFPRVYREPATLEAIKAAEKMEDLDTSQKQTIAAIKEQYERELAAANEKWASAVEARDDSIGDDPMAMAQIFMPGQEEKGPLPDAKKARKELDERTRERLVAALNDKQREKLPKAPAKHETAGGDGPFEMTVEEHGEDGEREVKVIVAPATESGGG